jgi:hypothetical protein
MQANKVKLVMIDRRGDFPLQDGLTSERGVTLQGGISPGAGCFVRRRVMGDLECWRIDAGPGPDPHTRCWQYLGMYSNMDRGSSKFTTFLARGPVVVSNC